MPSSSPLLLLLLLSLCAALCSAGNYDSLMRSLQDRNLQLHEKRGRAGFLDELDGRVQQLQARHYVRDSEYPRQFDPDAYWTDLLESHGAAAAADADAAVDAVADADAPEAMLQSPVSDRRYEEPYLNKIWGTQKVSGGAGEPGQVTGPEDKQQAPQVKTDRLPSYCDPPNPCPKGADPKKLGSPCSAEVEDTAEFNYGDTMRKLATGECPCDSEHMRCPDATPAAGKHAPASGHANPYLLGNKRDKLDAKKSPRLAVAKRGVKAQFRSRVVEKKNPWLDNGNKLETVEKKAGRHHYDLEEPLQA